MKLSKEQREEAQSYANKYGSCAVYHDGEKFHIIDSGDSRPRGAIIIEHFERVGK